jgi:hypothetical protein
MPERQDLPDLDGRAQPQPATAGAGRPDEVEGYNLVLDGEEWGGRRLIPSSAAGCSPTA